MYGLRRQPCPLTERVQVGAIYTDGETEIEIVRKEPLGWIWFQVVGEGVTSGLPISIFRSTFWRVA
jgi:hypothetical protein